MSLKYHCSIIFDKPHLTITHLKINDILYQHKRKLSINQRSNSINNNYKVEKLSLKQAKNIENLISTTRQYSLN